MVPNKMNTLNRIFTRNTLRQFIEEKSDSTYISLVKRYILNPETKNNRELISEIYCELKDNYRNEYFYKNTLLNKLLLGVHSINTTTALTEVPVAKSKADFILINGKAVVYEIKTELDNFDRLETQIYDYYKVFDHVAVVTCNENLVALEKKIENINLPIGIYILKKNGKLSTIRKPGQYTGFLDMEIMFKLLRKPEYESILKEKYRCLPDVTQFRYYSECKKLFLNIAQNEAYLLVLKQLKKRTILEKEDFIKVPYELKFLTYFMDLKKEDYQNLDIFLHQEYRGA